MRKKLLITLAALLGLGLIAGLGIGWLTFGPNTPVYTGTRSVKIPPGSDFESVVDSLDAAGIVQWDASFRWIARATGWGGQIKAGHYVFGGGLSNYRILNKLRRGLQEPVRVTIPPGTRPEVVAAVAGRDMYFSRAELDSVLNDSALAAELDTDTSHLFGFMLPETYFFYWLTSAENTVRKIKSEFDGYYDRELRADAESLGLSKEDIVTLASIVEWETAVTEEKPKVSGVYHNRLRIGMKLDADPTVQYAVMQEEGSKRRLFYADYDIQHPYNTYLRAGLPPGPLNNPSTSSLRAAAAPARHEFLYFVATGDGSHHFSRTLAEHNRAARRYHDLMRERRRAAQQEDRQENAD